MEDGKQWKNSQPAKWLKINTAGKIGVPKKDIAIAINHNTKKF